MAESPQQLARGMGREMPQPPASVRGETLPATQDKAARAQRCSPQRGGLKVAFRAYNTRAVPSSAPGAARDGMSNRMDHQLAPNGNTHCPGPTILVLSDSDPADSQVQVATRQRRGRGTSPDPQLPGTASPSQPAPCHNHNPSPGERRVRESRRVLRSSPT